MMLRGFRSNSSSIASRTDETGAANVADVPAAAPATSSVFRSALVKWNICATIDPHAPPVMMIGPSAPNGPPDPIEIGAEIGLRRATFGSIRLPFSRVDSIASGMPCRRIRCEPYPAINPTMSLPAQERTAPTNQGDGSRASLAHWTAAQNKIDS